MLAVRQWQAEHGPPPRYREWEKAAAGRPTSHTIARRWGWEALITDALNIAVTDLADQLQEAVGEVFCPSSRPCVRKQASGQLAGSGNQPECSLPGARTFGPSDRGRRHATLRAPWAEAPGASLGACLDGASEHSYDASDLVACRAGPPLPARSPSPGGPGRWSWPAPYDRKPGQTAEMT